DIQRAARRDHTDNSTPYRRGRKGPIFEGSLHAPESSNAMSSPAMLAAEIFVVDDKPANVALVCSMLRRAGYTCVSPFTDARVALDAAVHAAPDLIVLDLHMPELDGLAFIDELRARRSSADFVPILMLTADHTRE